MCTTGRLLKVFHEENPENIKWKDLSVDYVIDSSGKFTEKDDAMVKFTLSLNLVTRFKGVKNDTK